MNGNGNYAPRFLLALLSIVIIQCVDIVTVAAQVSTGPNQTSPEMLISSVTFDFSKVAPPRGDQTVPCSSTDIRRSCRCRVNNIEYLDNYSHGTFIMTPTTSNGYTWGRLAAAGDPLIDISCDDVNGFPRTPNLAMLRGVMSRDEQMITNIQYKERAPFTDESRADVPQSKGAPAPAQSESTKSTQRALYSVTFDFSRSAPPDGSQPVKCSPTDNAQSCSCSIVGADQLPNISHSTFTIRTAEFKGVKYGDLAGPPYNGPPVSLICSDKTGLRTPNMTMIRGLMKTDTGMVVNVVYKDRPLFPDELRAKPTESENRNFESDSERQVILDSLQATNGDLRETARHLGISEHALIRKIEEYKIQATYR